MHKGGKLVALLVAGVIATGVSPALAMGSGNPYQDAQVGLNYVVYQPNYMAGLALKNFGMHQCGVGDLALNVTYAMGKKSIFLTESSVNNICPMIMMLIRGATRTVVNKPAVGNLTATQVAVISVGISRAKLNIFFSHLVPRYTASGVVAPVLVDPSVVASASVALKNVLVFTVPDPDKWSATITDPTVVSFIAGGNQGTYVSNPSLKPLRRGTTMVTLDHNGVKVIFTVIVY